MLAANRVLGFTFFVVCLCVVAVVLGLIDLSTGQSRVLHAQSA